MQSRRAARSRCVPLLFAALLTPTALLHAQGVELDPFSTSKLTSTSRASQISDVNQLGCNPKAHPSGTVSLTAAIEFALCNNPQTQRDWAYAKAQAAAIGVAKSAYLPTLSVSGTSMHEKSSTRVDADPFYNNDIDSSLRTSRVDLNLVLYDFGLRSANLENARQLLAAANASHDATVQAVFINAAQAYYDAVTALTSLTAVRASKTLAETSFHAAEAGYKIGTGTQIDKLQAETAYSQEALKLVKAEGALQVAMGNLATTMGFPANTPFQVESLDDARLPDTSFVKSVDSLMDQAKISHPSLISARSQLRAAEAAEQSVRASGYPTLSFTANSNRAVQPTQQLGLPPLTTVARGNEFGVQLNIPLFEGFGRTYRVRQAAAQTEAKAADLAEVELQVSLSVWKSYQALQTAGEEVKVSEQYRSSAAKTLEAAQGRYKIGASEVLELLNAQTVMANAEQQHIQAVADWRTARLRLAFSLGMLGNWAIQ